MTSPKLILLVEDEMLIAMDIESTLVALGHRVALATSGPQAIAALDEANFDLAILDYHLRAGNSEEVALRLRENNVPFVVCSGTAGIHELGEAFIGARFLAKPFPADSLAKVVGDAIIEMTPNVQ